VPSTVRVTPVDDRVMARLSDAATPPGVLAVVRTPDTSARPPASGSVLVLDGVSDPGNVGTLLRTAAAFGVPVVSIGGADPFGPKAVRASAGTCYRVGVHRIDELDELGQALRGEGRSVLGLAADGDRSLVEAAEQAPVAGIALVVGSEPHGLGDEVRRHIDGLVRIPMVEGVESLNVAAAGAIALHALMHR
jgi:TrmH family RNA methyltransferase